MTDKIHIELSKEGFLHLIKNAMIDCNKQNDLANLIFTHIPKKLISSIISGEAINAKYKLNQTVLINKHIYVSNYDRKMTERNNGLINDCLKGIIKEINKYSEYPYTAHITCYDENGKIGLATATLSEDYIIEEYNDIISD